VLPDDPAEYEDDAPIWLTQALTAPSSRIYQGITEAAALQQIMRRMAASAAHSP
jgi:hypothetical protein